MKQKKIWNEVELVERITDLILDVGIPAHIKGYHYVREAIRITVLDMEAVTSVTKLLYPEVARLFRTSPQKVERAIRNAVEVAWKRNETGMKDYFGTHYWEKRPTNSEFIALAADRLNLED